MDRKYGEYQKILLNLKWFVKQLCRVFEEKLERRCSRDHHWGVLLGSSGGSLHGSVGGGGGTDSSDNTSIGGGSTQSTPRHKISNNRHSKHNKNLSKYLNTNGSSPTSANVSWTASLTNSPLLRRLSVLQQKSSNNSNESVSSSPKLKTRITPQSRLMLLLASTTQAEREQNLKIFGEHIAVVYEYQLGMLASLQAVSVVVVYVAELLLKALKKGILTGLEPANLNPTLLFDCTVIPKTGSKLVKTVGIGVHSNSLTWKVSSIFTHPGLRHNQVGGEDCTNLSIVTHLLTGYCPFGESRRPDIYGYRNLIVIPRRRSSSTVNSSSGISDEIKEIHKQQDSLKTQPNILSRTAYEISLYDSTTLGHTRSSSAESTPTTSTNSLLDHIHKCYKSIFFVIYERPAVIEHLMSCQSFRVFCTKELITPVMFLTSFNQTTLTSNHRSLFNNFDLFNICVTPHLKNLNNSMKSSSNLDANNNLKSPSHKNNPEKSSILEISNQPELLGVDKINLSDTKQSDMNSRDCCKSFTTKEYDNFAFNI